MRYQVIVEDEAGKAKEYLVGANRRRDLADEKREDESKSKHFDEALSKADPELTEKIQIAIDSVRSEYEHSFRRAERCDNKIYILLTVFGFLLVLLTGAMEKISEFDVIKVYDPYIVIFDILLILCVIIIIGFLVILIQSLSGKDFMRYDTCDILEKNLISSVDSKTLARLTIMKYEIARDYNNRLVSKQFKRVNIAVRLLIVTVVLLILLTVLGSFISSKNMNDLKVEDTKIIVDGEEQYPSESEVEYVSTEQSE